MGSPARGRLRDRDRTLDLGVAVLVGALVTAASASGLLSPLQRPAADALVRFAAGRPPATPVGVPDVAVVALDPQSLRAFPQWPWPRRVYAQTVERLDAAGAKVIAFDIDFSTPRDAGDDAQLGAAIQRSGRVVLAAFRQVTRLPGGGEIEVASVPLDALSAGAAGVGSVLVPVDPDGIVRRAPSATALGGRVIPSLAAMAIAAAVGDGTAPDAAADFVLDYRRAGPGFPVLSIADVVEGRFDPRDVAGRIVLIGATAAEFQDLWPTPLGPARPGVAIQAVAVRTLAAERVGAAVLATPSGVETAVSCFLLSLAAALAGTVSHRARLLALLALAALGGGLAAALALGRGLVVEPVSHAAVLGLHYVLGLETLQRRFGRRLAARESSLAALFQVGEAAVGARPTGALEVALALLGDVIGARAVALLRAASPEPMLDGRRIEWRRGGGSPSDRPVGDLDTARLVLDARALRVVTGVLPGGGSGLVVYLPLFSATAAVGVLVVERDDPRPLDETELRTLSTVGTQLSLSAENLRLIDGLRETFDASIAAIATAIEARDGYTEAHCRRLATFSSLIAERLGMSDEEIEAIRLGALLHDVGKIGIRDQILLKPGRFSPEERAEMQRHPSIGTHIIGRITGLSQTTLDCVLHHHEWWNGSGYPDRLAGDAIPLGARIVAVVDVWDALSTARPYKAALAPDVVREALEKNRGVQFDPALVDLFLRILDEQGEELLRETRS